MDNDYRELAHRLFAAATAMLEDAIEIALAGQSPRSPSSEVAEYARALQPPKATFVTRLRNSQLPNRPARQLPDQPTTLWVVPSSTGDPRLRGALSGVGYERTSSAGLLNVRF